MSDSTTEIPNGGIPSDALREHCHDLLDEGCPALAVAVRAVYAYARGFAADIPDLAPSQCPHPDCIACMLYVQKEISLTKETVEMFLGDIRRLCQQVEADGHPDEQTLAAECREWLYHCHLTDEPQRYLNLPEPSGMLRV